MGFRQPVSEVIAAYSFIALVSAIGFGGFVAVKKLLKRSGKYYGRDNFFINEIVDHPNYDDFWKKRDLLPHLKNIKHAVMTVGGWFDAEDLRGPLHVISRRKTIEFFQIGAARNWFVWVRKIFCERSRTWRF